MRRIIVLIFLFETARAEMYLFGGYGYRTEKGSDGQYGEVFPILRLGAGHTTFEKIHFAVELSFFSEQTSTGNIQIISDHYKFLLSAKASPWLQPSWYPYGSVGLGAKQTVVTTSSGGQSRQDYSLLSYFPSLGVGVFNKVYGGLAVGIEAKAQINLSHEFLSNAQELFFDIGYYF